jgi:hypothetical protein
MSDSFYFYLSSRSVPTSNAAGKRIFWTPVERGAIKEVTEEVAKEYRELPLFKQGVITEVTKEEYEALKKKVVTPSSAWYQPQFDSPPMAPVKPPTPSPSVAAVAADSKPTDGRKRRSKPATSVGALETP